MLDMDAMTRKERRSAVKSPTQRKPHYTPMKIISRPQVALALTESGTNGQYSMYFLHHGIGLGHEGIIDWKMAQGSLSDAKCQQ
jgi:hypothetical protein